MYRYTIRGCSTSYSVVPSTKTPYSCIYVDTDVQRRFDSGLRGSSS